MAFESFDILMLYKAMQLVLLFWLLALLFKWLLAFILGEKGAIILGAIGYATNFFLKKLALSKLFRIEVTESDPFKLTFKHEETNRWDILFPSFVLIPMSIGLFMGTIVGTLGLVFQEDLPIISIFLYIAGFFIAVNSVPTIQDVKELKDCSARSLVIWFLIATIACGIFAAIFVPFLGILGAVIGVIVGIMLTTILTVYVTPISERMTASGTEGSSLIGGTVDLDG